MRLRILLLFVLVSGLMVFSTQPSFAQTTITVDTLADGTLAELGMVGGCQLREALQAIGDVSSMTDTDGDGNINTVNGVCDATGSGLYIIEFGASGTLVVDNDQFAGTMPEVPTNYNVTINGGNTVTIDPPPADDAFNMDSSRTMTFTNLIFTGDNNPATNDGQAITNDGGTLIIDMVTFTGLSHDWGAAIRNSGTLTITDSSFINNAATSTSNGNGGAITTSFDTTIMGSNFTGNSAVNLGGAIYISNNSTTITASNFTNNTAASGDDNEGGGAIFIQGGDLTIMGTAFSLNAATGGSGGAIYANSDTTIIGSTFDGNIAGGTNNSDNFTIEGGGAIYVVDTVNVDNAAFVGNIASNHGGGMMFRAGSYVLTVNNSTFALNIAGGNGGGVYFGPTSSNYDVTLANVTIANNAAMGGAGLYHEGSTGWARLFQTLIADNAGSDCTGEIDQTPAGGFNLIQNAAGCTNVDSTDLLNVGADLGTFTGQFYLLGSSSPAIDGGSPTDCSNMIDQNLFLRPQDGDGDPPAVCDIGAIEMPPGSGGNQTPMANNDAYSTDEDVTLDVTVPGVLGNDTDADGDPMTAILVSDVSNGVLMLNSDGSFSYTPNAGYNGSDSFTYQVSDGAELSNIAIVTITVNALGNALPVAVDDSYIVAEDGTLNEALPGVLTNDTDADGDPLTAVLDSDVTNGTLTLNPDGSFDYTPDADFEGSDSFTYFANDGTVDSAAAATVTITVTAVNDAPEAFDDNYITDEGVTMNIPVAGVLDNDIDVDGDMLSAVLDMDVTNGTLLLNSDGSFSYDPAPLFSGTDSFTYFANDGTVDSAVAATVTITVNQVVNVAPVATDDAYGTNEDTPLTIAAPGVLANDTDGDLLTAGSATQPANGSVTLNADGSFTYTPNADFNGMDTFTYMANDGTDDSNVATVTITVTAVNDAPVATDDAYVTDEGMMLTIIAVDGVLDNDTDVDGDMLSAMLDANVGVGTLTLNLDGSFNYIPAGGPDIVTFTYHANDGTADSNIATVTITINSAGNDAPIAANDAYMTDQDVPLNIAAPGVLANDTDADGDTLSAVLDAAPSNGILVFNANGSFSYTPNMGYFGMDSFTYHANDSALDSNIATVTFTVNQVISNTAPVAVDDAYMTDQDVVLNIVAPGVLANDTDVDGDPLSAVLDMGPSNGILVFNANGSFSYTPNAGFFGSDSFSYHANDGTDNSNVVTVTLTVNQVVNTPPVAVDDGYMTDQDVALNVAAPGVLGNDTDADGDALSAVLDVGPSNGILVFNANGSFTYTPNMGYFGADNFTYHAYDGTANSNVVTVTLTVNQVVNTPPVAVDDGYMTDQDVILNIVAPGVLGNDTDADGDALSAVLDVGPSNGILVFNADGSFTYTPNMGYFGADNFTYHAYDGTANSNVVTVTITVNAVGGGNNAPVANNDTYNVDQDSALNISAPGVLANDTDTDGDPLTAVLGTGASNGIVTLNPDGSFIYTPNAGYNGPDSFTYMANDGTVDSNLALVSITVNVPGSTPAPVVIFYPTPDPVPLCADISGETSSIVRADIPQGATDANVYCRVIVENGSYEYTSGAIGNLDLLNRGVRQAVDVFALSESGSVVRFNLPVTVCLLGSGDLFYMDATQAPRVPQLITTFMSGGYTCAIIPNAGTLVLVG